LWMPVRLSATTPVSLNGCGGPWWDVSKRELNSMEDILSTDYKCTLSAITNKLNVSGHMLIWIFFLILVWGTRAQSLSPILLFTICIKKSVCLFDICTFPHCCIYFGHIWQGGRGSPWEGSGYLKNQISFTWSIPKWHYHDEF
jgi:hypothetical protein